MTNPTTTKSIDKLMGQTYAAIVRDHFARLTSQLATPTTDQIAELVACLRYHADAEGVDWREVVGKANARYRQQNPTTPAEGGDLYRVGVVLPDGFEVMANLTKPYDWAVIEQTAQGWGVRGWASQRHTADARASGIRMNPTKNPSTLAVKAARTTVYGRVVEGAEGESVVPIEAAPVVDAQAVEATAEERMLSAIGITAEDLPFEPTPADVVDEAPADVVEFQAVKFAGSKGKAVHWPNAEYTDTLCGAGQGRDLQQTGEAVNCKNCQRLAGH